ncbi:hypothetical protein GQ53DRAFT_888465 [Thozetella sp. PMI_491]|nr:hypothetical protein GQ53DRAFT_888465 [Thozetella sp. PMI_491]
MKSLLLQIGLLLSAACPGTRASQSSKRGLIFVPNSDSPSDNALWVGSGLTWYHNFGWSPSAEYADVPASTIEFVPMLWGAVNDTSFLQNITALIDSGYPISHILSFSEPDASWSAGGSNMTPSDAAEVWVNNLVPLQEMGIKIGLPVMKAQDDPHTWLDPFVGNCSELLEKECTFDFMSLHSYGNFSSLEMRVDLFSAAFPDTPIWITEYGYDHQTLNVTQDFFNQSLSYLDSTDIVERYAYFGAFRSIVSNLGYNAAFLDPYGNLTDIGSWYLGGNATGNAPMPSFSGSTSSSNTSSSTSCTSVTPCGKKNEGPVGTKLVGVKYLAVFFLFFLVL